MPGKPPILAYHVIFGAYGFWLPDDPRDSWSDFVGSWELFRFGPATRVHTRRSVAGRAHDHTVRLAAKRALKHPPVVLSGIQARAVGHGFAWAIRESGYAVHSCSILPEHVHLVIGPHDRAATGVVKHLKTRATQRLIAECGWPRGRPVWAKRCWKVFLYDPADVRRAIRYVRDNPAKEGLPPQHWSFVTSWTPPDKSKRVAGMRRTPT